MKLQTQQVGKPQCLLYSFAMAMDIDAVELAKKVGHDGLEKVWPDLQPPKCYIGHNPIELMLVALDLGYAVTMLPAIVESAPTPESEPYACICDMHTHFIKCIVNGRGVICTDTHACAYDRYAIFDSNGKVYGATRELIQKITYLFAVNEIKSD